MRLRLQCIEAQTKTRRTVLIFYGVLRYSAIFHPESLCPIQDTSCMADVEHVFCCWQLSNSWRQHHSLQGSIHSIHQLSNLLAAPLFMKLCFSFSFCTKRRRERCAVNIRRCVYSLTHASPDDESGFLPTKKTEHRRNGLKLVTSIINNAPYIFIMWFWAVNSSKLSVWPGGEHDMNGTREGRGLIYNAKRTPQSVRFECEMCLCEGS